MPARRKRLLLCILLLVAPACGEARYRLEGQVDAPSETLRIALLDSTAVQKIDQIHRLYAAAADSVSRVFADSLSSLDADLAALEPPIEKAEERLKAARNNYAFAFRSMTAFTSFGGNPIFTASDRRVPTKTLLEEIADRFYKGKAFSLETGGRIRTTIREKLVPAEARVTRAQASLNRLRKSRDQAKEKRDAFAGKIDATRRALLAGYNRRVLDRLEGAILRETRPDSSGSFRFDRVARGRYHVYAPSPSPRLFEVPLQGHLRVRVGPADPSPLIAG